MSQSKAHYFLKMRTQFNQLHELHPEIIRQSRTKIRTHVVKATSPFSPNYFRPHRHRSEDGIASSSAGARSSCVETKETEDIRYMLTTFQPSFHMAGGPAG